MKIAWCFGIWICCALGAQFFVDIGTGTEDGRWLFMKYYPSLLTINAGDNVTFIQKTAEDYTVVFPAGSYPYVVGFDANTVWYHPALMPIGSQSVTSQSAIHSSGVLYQDETATFTFPAPGTFTYCDIEHGFTGSIVVLSENASIPFSPDEIAQSVTSMQDTDMALIPMLDEMWHVNSTKFPEVLPDGTKVVYTGTMLMQYMVALHRFIPSNFSVNRGDRVMFYNPGMHLHTVIFDNSFSAFPVNWLQFDSNITVLNGEFGPGVVRGPRYYFDPSSPGDLSNYTGGFLSAGVLTFGENATITFKEDGHFPLICSIHLGLGMIGSATVTSSASTAGLPGVVLLLSILMYLFA